MADGCFFCALDENYTLTSNELSDEIAALQHRIAELSADLAEA